MLKIEYILLEYFRRQKPGTLLDLRKNCCISNVHWSEGNDVLDSLCYAIYGEYATDHSKYGYGASKGNYRVKVEMTIDGKWVAMRRTAPAGVQKYPEPHSFTVEVTGKDGEKHVYIGKAAREIRLELIPVPKNVFVASICFGPNKTDFFAQPDPVKEQVLRPIIGTGSFLQAFNESRRIIRTYKTQYEILLNRRQKTLEKITQEGNLFSQLYSEGRKTESEAFAKSKSMVREIDTVAAIISKISTTIVLLQSGVGKTKMVGKDDFVEDDSFKQELMKVKDTTNKVLAYSRIIGMKEQCNVLEKTLGGFSQALAIISDVIDRIERFRDEKPKKEESMPFPDVCANRQIICGIKTKKKMGLFRQVLGDDDFHVLEDMIDMEREIRGETAELEKSRKFKKFVRLVPGTENAINREEIEEASRHCHFLSEADRFAEKIIDGIFEVRDKTFDEKRKAIITYIHKPVATVERFLAERVTACLEEIYKELQTIRTPLEENMRRVQEAYRKVLSERSRFFIDNQSLESLKRGLVLGKKELKNAFERLAKIDTSNSEQCMKEMKAVSGALSADSEKILLFLQKVLDKLGKELLWLRQRYSAVVHCQTEIDYLNIQLNQTRQSYLKFIHFLGKKIGIGRFFEKAGACFHINAEVERQRHLLVGILGRASQFATKIYGHEISLHLVSNKNGKPNLDFFVRIGLLEMGFWMVKSPIRNILEISFVLALFEYARTHNNPILSQTIILDRLLDTLTDDQYDMVLDMLNEEKDLTFIVLTGSETQGQCYQTELKYRNPEKRRK